MRPLTANFRETDKRPYFLWDEDWSVDEVRDRLASGTEEEKERLLAKILREARDDEVWQFTTIQDVWRRWPRLAPRLGRRRAFWEFVFNGWRRQGLLP